MWNILCGYTVKIFRIPEPSCLFNFIFEENEFLYKYVYNLFPVSFGIFIR